MKRTGIRRRKPLMARAALAPGNGLRRKAAMPAVRKALRPSRSTGRATPAQSARWDTMLVLGCLCCWINRAQKGLATASFARARPGLEIHHLTSAGRRIGHDHTICLCRYHHQGDLLPYTGAGYREQAVRFGPSYGREKARFRSVYGADVDLLALQNSMLGAP